MPGCGFRLQFGLEFPVLLLEQAVPKAFIRVFQPVDKEFAEQIVAGMIGGPDLIFVVGDQMAIHANQHTVLRPQRRSPASKVAQSRGPSIVAEYRTEGQKKPGRGYLGHVRQSVLECAPETAAFDNCIRAAMVGNQARYALVKRGLGNVEGQVRGRDVAGFELGQEMVNFCCIARMTEAKALVSNSRSWTKDDEANA